MRKQKSLIFVMVFMVLLIGLTAISATDTSNNTVNSTVVSYNAVNAHTSDINKITSDTKVSTDTIKTGTKKM